jgi:hypothetical protein
MTVRACSVAKSYTCCRHYLLVTNLPHSKALSQLKHLQRLLLLDAERPDLDPVARAQVVRAWKELEYLRRDIKMLPKPKPIDVLPPLRGPGGRLMRKLTDAQGRSPQTIDLVADSAPTEAPVKPPSDAKKLDIAPENPHNKISPPIEYLGT